MRERDSDGFGNGAVTWHPGLLLGNQTFSNAKLHKTESSLVDREEKDQYVHTEEHYSYTWI